MITNIFPYANSKHSLPRVEHIGVVEQPHHTPPPPRGPRDYTTWTPTRNQALIPVFKIERLLSCQKLELLVGSQLFSLYQLGTVCITCQLQGSRWTQSCADLPTRLVPLRLTDNQTQIDCASPQRKPNALFHSNRKLSSRQTGRRQMIKAYNDDEPTHGIELSGFFYSSLKVY